ncbi:MAG TPA: site-specific integrase [Phycisphaerae bacterium]|nr:site-specific integrase [Phycisphaerae bacterium]
MAKTVRSGRPERVSIGSVTLYVHHGAWWINYRDGGRRVRRRVGGDRDEAEAVAAAVNAQLALGQRSMFAFDPVDLGTMLDRWLDHHEHVLQSSVATTNRYRTATDHARRYAATAGPGRQAHQFDANSFVRYLRTIRVTPNGHPNAARRGLTAKGIQFILATCRSAFHYAARHRMMPPYGENPFTALPIRRMADTETRRPIHVFSEDEEYRFLAACDRWQFPIFYVFARTGLRPAELTHLLVDEVDLHGGLLTIRSKPDLGWQVKTRRPRAIPLPREVVAVLESVIGNRRQGLLFLRRRFVEGEGPPLFGLGPTDLKAELERRVRCAEREQPATVDRRSRLKIAAGLWRDAGAIKPERVRTEFCGITQAIGLKDVTAPKCWRHTLATLMLEAEVDPLVRQLTLGHRPADDAKAALGMTSVYTHVTPEVHRRQLQRVIDLRPKTSGLVDCFLSEAHAVKENESC